MFAFRVSYVILSLSTCFCDRAGLHAPNSPLAIASRESLLNFGKSAHSSRNAGPESAVGSTLKWLNGKRRCPPKKSTHSVKLEEPKIKHLTEKILLSRYSRRELKKLRKFILYLEETKNEKPKQDFVCLHGGKKVGDFECKCQSGYIGRQCEILPEPEIISESLPNCNQKLCLNAGKCKSTGDWVRSGLGSRSIGGYRCVCPSGFSRRYCEKSRTFHRVFRVQISIFTSFHLSRGQRLRLLLPKGLPIQPSLHRH